MIDLDKQDPAVADPNALISKKWFNINIHNLKIINKHTYKQLKLKEKNFLKRKKESEIIGY